MLHFESIDSIKIQFLAKFQPNQMLNMAIINKTIENNGKNGEQ